MIAAQPANGARDAVRAQDAVQLHAAVWAVWLAVACAMVFLTSNPLYLTTIALASLIVYAAHRGRGRRALDYLLMAGVLLSSLTIPLNLISGSTGATEIVALPSARLPGWLGGVTLGGPVTAESLLYALAQALGLTAIFVSVCAFNSGVDHFKLLKAVPASFAQLGIVLNVGLLLAPETLARAATLRDARTVRGHTSRGAGAAVALALPLLGDALERAVRRAESLDARGFGRLTSKRGPLQSVAAIAGLTIASAGAFTLYYTDRDVLPLAAIAAGGALVAAAVLSGGGAHTTRLRPAPLMMTDLAVLASCAIALAIFFVFRATEAAGLGYLPFPEAITPAYNPLAALACVFLAAPAFAARGDST